MVKPTLTCLLTSDRVKSDDVMIFLCQTLTGQGPLNVDRTYTCASWLGSAAIEFFFFSFNVPRTEKTGLRPFGPLSFSFALCRQKEANEAASFGFSAWLKMEDDGDKEGSISTGLNFEW